MSAENIINIEFWQVVSFFLTFLGVCFGFAKILFAQFKTALDDRLALLEKMQAKLEMVEQSHNELLRQLPLDYMRREDHIRNESKLEAKIDAVYGIMSDIYKMESHKK